MDATTTQCKVHQCFNCPGETEYFCKSCSCDLCSQCNVNHVENLKTIEHDVVLHREKFNYISKQEICMRHPSKDYRNYCELCKLPVCYHCRKHRKHKQQDIEIAYETKLQQHRKTVNTIRSEALFYKHILLAGIKSDVKTCLTEFSLFQSKVLTKVQKVKDWIDYAIEDLMYNVFLFLWFQTRMFKTEDRNAQTSCLYPAIWTQIWTVSKSALQFLLATKILRLPQMHRTLHTSQVSMTETRNKRSVIELLSGIEIIERGKRHIVSNRLMELMPKTGLHLFLTLTGVNCCHHMSCETLKCACVRDDDDDNSRLKNTTSEIEHHLKDFNDSDDRHL